MQLPKKYAGGIFLVVDDVGSMRKITHDQLLRIGADTVLQAANAVDALRLINSHNVTMVLCDWNMPTISGLELVKALRANPRHASVPVILMSGEANRELVAAAREADVASLMIKPYNATVLLDRVERAFAWRPRRSGVPVRVKAPVSDTRPVILWVDDRAISSDELITLCGPGYDIRCVASGPEAIAICQSDDPPDLMIVDAMMPSVDGYAVMKTLRAHPVSRTLPIILTVDESSRASVMQGMDLGAMDVMIKPVDPDMMRAKVRNFLHHAMLYKQLREDHAELLAASRLREDIDYITDHDVRTPLMAALKSVKCVSETARLTASQLKVLGEVQLNVKLALDLVNISTELIKMETGQFKFVPEPVDLFPIIVQSVERIKATHPSVRIATASVNAMTSRVMGDDSLCYSMCSQLLAYAASIAGDQGRIEVSWQVASCFEFVITVEGGPLALSQQELGGGSVPVSPTFHIARTLTVAQGGQIDCVSDPVTGITRITVSLPLLP